MIKAPFHSEVCLDELARRPVFTTERWRSQLRLGLSGSRRSLTANDQVAKRTAAGRLRCPLHSFQNGARIVVCANRHNLFGNDVKVLKKRDDSENSIQLQRRRTRIFIGGNSYDFDALEDLDEIFEAASEGNATRVFPKGTDEFKRVVQRQGARIVPRAPDCHLTKALY